MKKYNFTEGEIIQAYVKANNSIRGGAKLLGVPRETFREWIYKIGLKPQENAVKTAVKSEERKPKIPLEIAQPDTLFTYEPREKARYVITCAQNNTDIFKPFFEALKLYCQLNNAKLIVIPIRYKNVTAYINNKDTEVFWPSELQSYYLNDDIYLNKNLMVMGSFKIQATAINPLVGVGAIAGQCSAIFGHSQIALETLPTPANELPRILTTTGSLSVKNYSSSKAGRLADFNHSYGASVVEIDGDKFFIRQINATDDGSFYDLNGLYSVNGFSFSPRCSAIKYGDIHSDFLDENVVKATWTDINSIVNTLDPEHEFLDDALDFYSGSHHHRGNIYLNYVKLKSGMNLVREELDRVVENHNEYWCRSGTQYHYVASNHNEHFLRWLKETDPRSDLANLSLWCEMQLLMLHYLQYSYKGAYIPNPLELYMRSKINNPERTTFHSRTESVIIRGVDFGQHGDVGPNGAKGSAQAFVRSGYKVSQGHHHGPSINKGVYTSGTSAGLTPEYVRGYGSAMHTHCIQYMNGKRTLIHIIGGQWRLED